MTALTPVMPRQPAPALSVETLDHGSWTLANQTPENFTLIVAYRGLHCPICKGYLLQLQGKLDEFKELGINVIALSSDGRDRAEQTKKDWHLDKLTIGYGLDLDTARTWGLYISEGIGKTSIGVEEPDLFAEPGLFLVRPDGTIYFATVQTMPFARPHFDDIVTAAKFVLERGYPARGEVLDHSATKTAAE